MELYRLAYRLQIVGDFRRTPCVILGRDVQFFHEATGRRVDPSPPKFFLRYSTHPNLKSSQQALFDHTSPLLAISI